MKEDIKQSLKDTGIFISYLLIPATIAWLAFDQLIINSLIDHVSILFIVLAGIFSALMDSIENEHINNTIFSKLNPNFWSKRVSWNKSFTLVKYKFDAWHLAKSAMITSWIAAILTYTPVNTWYWDMAVAGFFYNWSFNGFYNYIFKKS